MSTGAAVGATDAVAVAGALGGGRDGGRGGRGGRGGGRGGRGGGIAQPFGGAPAGQPPALHLHPGDPIVAHLRPGQDRDDCPLRQRADRRELPPGPAPHGQGIAFGRDDHGLAAGDDVGAGDRGG